LNDAAALDSFASRRLFFHMRITTIPETATIDAAIPPTIPAIELLVSSPLDILPVDDDCGRDELLVPTISDELEEEFDTFEVLLVVLILKVIVVKAVGVTVGIVEPIIDDGRALNSRCWASAAERPLFGL
jgi:hypothetical protein